MVRSKIIMIVVVGLLLMSSLLGVVSLSHNFSKNSVNNTGSLDVRSDEAVIHGIFVIDQNTTDPITGEKGKYGFDSSVKVDKDGTLIVKNATLYFLSDITHIYHLTVYGNLTLYNATLTVSTDVIQPSYTINVEINGSSHPPSKVKIIKSKILYSGWFNITDKNENILIKDSIFDKVPSAPAPYDYAPTVFIYYSKVIIENTSFNNLFEHGSSGYGYIGNMTDSHSYNSGGSITNFDQYIPTGYTEYWYLPVVKKIQINVTYDNTTDYDGSSYVTVKYKGQEILNCSLPSGGKTASASNTTFGSAGLTAEDIWNARTGELTVYITPANNGDVTVTKTVLSFYIEKNFIIYGLHRFDFTLNSSVVYAKDVYIGADYEARENWGTTHNRIALFEKSKLYALNLTVERPTTSKEDSCIFANDSFSSAYIFRYGNINVTYNSYPVPNVNVSAVPYLLNAGLENDVINITYNFTKNMSYGNVSKQNRSVYMITNEVGEVLLPLLSDIINKSEYPNSEFVGIYNVYVNRTDKPSLNPLYRAQIGLDHYPNLLPTNNTFVYHAALDKYKDVDISVKIVNIAKPCITNHELNITVNVTNAGSEDAENISIILYVNGNEVDEQNISNLQANNYTITTLHAPATIFSTAGVYNITVKAEQKWDTDLSNNTETRFIKVGDMYVDSWNVSKLVRYHDTTITFTVYSSYDVAEVNISLWICNASGNTSVNYSTVNLSSGLNQITFAWNNINVAKGDYILVVYANNTDIGKKDVYVYKDVDLKPSFTISTEQPYMVNKEIKINVDVHNDGTEGTSNAYFVVYVNNDIANTSQTFNVGGGGDHSVNDILIPASFFSLPGKYNITVIVYDSEDYNPSNNMTWQIITVGDIYIDSWSVEKLIRNHTATISINIYSSYEVHNTNVYLYIDNTATLLNVWHSLNAGMNVLTYNWYVNGTAGPRTFYVYINGTLLGSHTENMYKDVDVKVNDIYTNPATVYQHEIIYVISSVVNVGTDPATAINIEVDIYDPLNERVYHNVFSYSGYDTKHISVELQPEYVGVYTVNITVLGSEDWNPDNNFMSYQFTVNSNPYITTLKSGTGEYVNGTDVFISYEIYSNIYASMNVTLYVKELNLVLQPINTVNPIVINENSMANVSFRITQSQYSILLRNTVSINVHFWISIESNRTGKGIKLNYTTYSFKLKEKPDFEVVPGTFYVLQNGKKVSKAAEGVKVEIFFTVKNIGGTMDNVSYQIRDNNKNISTGVVIALESYAIYNVTYNYTVSGVGTHTFEIVLNPNKNVSERSYSNDKSELSFSVIPPDMEIYYAIKSQEHGNTIYTEDHVIITITIINKNATKSQGRNVYLSGVSVTVKFGSLSKKAYTNSNGVAQVIFTVKNAGTYSVTINAQYHGASKVITPGTNYKVKPKPFEIPWLWIIIAAVAGGIGGFFAYGYLSFKKEAKEYMVCGNCGRLVPADAERCPYCGAVFEKEKVKCPECGSWIDEDAKFCPVCGTVFMSEEDPEYEKQVSLKERYEQYLSKYKEEAKKYIGEEYTTEEFFNWWKTHPEYISFQDWVKRQEEEIAGETVTCPVCGAINPKGAKICRVCGSPLPTEEEEEKEKMKMPEEKRPEEIEEKAPEEMKVEEEKVEEKKEITKKELEKITQPGVVSYEEWAAKKAEEVKPPEKREEKVEEKKEEEKEEGFIKCPVCGALNPKDAKVCSVCGAPLVPEEEKKEEKKRKVPPKPVVKRKVIKKVIPVKKEEENQ